MYDMWNVNIYLLSHHNRSFIKYQLFFLILTKERAVQQLSCNQLNLFNLISRTKEYDIH